MASTEQHPVDLFVIGGGVNGCGIARDAAGRGLSVTLAEMNDLASATSSASTKLFHGGLRYLEYFEFRLVHEALVEREILLRAMPHISWPMRFVLPYHSGMRFESGTPTSRLLETFMPWMHGRRPAWLIRLGLWLYDTLGGREILPGTRRLNLQNAPEGAPLKGRFHDAFEYSDCWVEDARLVALNARDASDRGARILTRTRVTEARRIRSDGRDLWHIVVQDTGTGAQSHVTARALVNAGGPWVGQVIHDVTHVDSRETVRLVRGSHIVTRRLFDHDKAYFFQGTDGRIIFAIPYQGEFTLIGTTDADHHDPAVPAVCTPEEEHYLCRFASEYFRVPVTSNDVVWRYSGVRPLYDDGATSATAATRDYVLKLDHDGAPLINVFGGKITTYRRLSEAAVNKLRHRFPHMGAKWTAGVPLAGGDFEVDGVPALVAALHEAFPFLSADWALRLVRAYGTEAAEMLAGAQTAGDLGRAFGATLTEREVTWQITHEFARTAEDVVWRRSKLGLHLSDTQIRALDTWMQSHLSGAQDPGTSRAAE
ncbi:MAG: glycerol-3-phosphate dehydrogenase [Pseudomonadota bacterium]